MKMIKKFGNNLTSSARLPPRAGANSAPPPWRGRNTKHFELVVRPLTDVAATELFDWETGAWGHIMLDHVILL